MSRGHPRVIRLLVAATLLTGGGCAASVPTSEAAAHVAAPWPKLEAASVGPGWRISDGVFVGLESRLRARGGDGWAPFVGGPMAALVSDTDVGLRHEQLDVVVAISRLPHAVEPPDPSEAFALLGVEAQDRQATVVLLGEGMPLEIAAGRSHVYLYGSLARGDETLLVLAWYPAEASSPLVEGKITDAMAGFEEIDPVELRQLEAELRTDPDSQNAIGEDWVVRRGLYRNFKYDLEWRIGRGWIIDARPPDPTTLFEATGRKLVASLTVASAPGLELDSPGLHAATLADATAAGAVVLGPNRQIAVGEAVAWVDDVRYEQAGRSGVFALASVRHGDLIATMLVGGAEPVARARHDDFDVLIAGGRFSAGLERELQLDGRFVDVHAGFALRPPARSSMRTKPLELGLWSRERVWLAGVDSVTVVALSWSGDNQRFAAAQDLLIDYIEQSRALAIRPSSSTEPIELDGEPGVHRRWTSPRQYDDVVICNRDRTLYLVHVRSRGPKLFEQALASFEFVD